MACPLKLAAAAAPQRSSLGPAFRREVQARPVIELPLELGEHRWPIEITLADRKLMGFRLLLGRTALRRRVLVDPGGAAATAPRGQPVTGVDVVIPRIGASVTETRGEDFERPDEAG